MIETFQSFNARDFRQRYQGTFGYFTTDAKKRILVYLREVTDTELTFQDVGGTFYTAHADTGVEFEFIPVSKKLFLIKDVLYLAQRRPARQWSRGVNSHNTSIIKVASGDSLYIGFDTIQPAYVSEPVDVLPLVKQLEEKKRTSVVLSDVFGIINTTLYVYGEVIGSFLPDTKEVKLDSALFAQEVKDLFRSLDLSYKVSHV